MNHVDVLPRMDGRFEVTRRIGDRKIERHYSEHDLANGIRIVAAYDLNSHPPVELTNDFGGAAVRRPEVQRPEPKK